MSVQAPLQWRHSLNSSRPPRTAPQAGASPDNNHHAPPAPPPARTQPAPCGEGRRTSRSRTAEENTTAGGVQVPRSSRRTQLAPSTLVAEPALPTLNTPAHGTRRDSHTCADHPPSPTLPNKSLPVTFETKTPTRTQAFTSQTDDKRGRVRAAGNADTRSRSAPLTTPKTGTSRPPNSHTGEPTKCGSRGDGMREAGQRAGRPARVRRRPRSRGFPVWERRICSGILGRSWKVNSVALVRAWRAASLVVDGSLRSRACP